MSLRFFRVALAVVLTLLIAGFSNGRAQEKPQLNMDREKLALRFEITADGGRIHFAAREPGDRGTRNAIGNHGRMIEEKLRAGDFAPLLALLPASAAEPARELWRRGGIPFTIEPEAAGICLTFTASSVETRV